VTSPAQRRFRACRLPSGSKQNKEILKLDIPFSSRNSFRYNNIIFNTGNQLDAALTVY
jgi:hypothetical protein